MVLDIQPDKKTSGIEAGKKTGALIRSAIKEKGHCNIILATGSSQFETLKQLVKEEGIDWSKVIMFHLDEYIGLPITDKASFRKYLKERFLDKVSSLKAVYLINGEADPEEETQRLGELIKKNPIDVALVGIGENGHLAFNDPPADFDTTRPYLIANLDHTCRQQQVNEGWFDTFGDVPKQAISMSIRQIMKSRHIICTVPGERKAQAVKDCLGGKITNLHPSSILQQHPDCYIFLDTASASLLKREVHE